MKSVKRIVCEVGPGPQDRRFHTTAPVVTSTQECTISRALADKTVDSFSKFGLELGAARAVRRLWTEIPGLLHIHIKPFTIEMRLARAFDFQDAQPEVLEILRTELFGEEAEVEIA